MNYLYLFYLLFLSSFLPPLFLVLPLTFFPFTIPLSSMYLFSPQYCRLPLTFTVFPFLSPQFFSLPLELSPLEPFPVSSLNSFCTSFPSGLPPSPHNLPSLNFPSFPSLFTIFHRLPLSHPFPLFPSLIPLPSPRILHSSAFYSVSP